MHIQRKLLYYTPVMGTQSVYLLRCLGQYLLKSRSGLEPVSRREIQYQQLTDDLVTAPSGTVYDCRVFIIYYYYFFFNVHIHAVVTHACHGHTVQLSAGLSV